MSTVQRGPVAAASGAEGESINGESVPDWKLTVRATNITGGGAGSWAVEATIPWAAVHLHNNSENPRTARTYLLNVIVCRRDKFESTGECRPWSESSAVDAVSNWDFGQLHLIGSRGKV